MFSARASGIQEGERTQEADFPNVRLGSRADSTAAPKTRYLDWPHHRAQQRTFQTTVEGREAAIQFDCSTDQLARGTLVAERSMG